MTNPLPAPAVVRVSRVTFDPKLYADIAGLDKKVSEYLVPAIERLPGFLHMYAGVSPEGSFVQISVWDTEEHAAQMDQLKEMNVTARGEFTAAGVSFGPEHATIVNYPITWTI